MSKEKDLFIEMMRVFVSASIYMVMGLVVIFIFYQAVVLLFFVVSSIYVHIEYLSVFTVGGLTESSRVGIQLAEQVLNIVTFILVLVKSFKILVSYSKHHHISIKDLVEISIIALLMEVVFNFGLHSMPINRLFAVLSIVLIIIYAIFPQFHDDDKKKKNNKKN